ncbi:hypothetical protein PG993_008892 [Apiospora rasikravindrae]|uniref:Rhodopsin domain-containing protein n=1 Tax=Apiospora rasikravindrae TaxID=990691 RepID=A0ABR1SPM8_9PEZI
MSRGTTGPVIIGVTMVTQVLAAVAVGLRLWSLQINRRKFVAHDVFVLIGFVSAQYLPLSYYWDKLIPGGTCGNIDAAYPAVRSINLVLDCSVALIPSTVLWGLLMPARKKVGIATMFTLGALICVISTVRVVYQFALGIGEEDLTLAGSPLYLFTGIEPHLACISACMPLLRPVYETLASSRSVAWIRSFIGQFKGREHPDRNVDSGRASFLGLRRGPLGECHAMPWNRLSDDEMDGIQYTIPLEQRSTEGRVMDPTGC